MASNMMAIIPMIAHIPQPESALKIKPRSHKTNGITTVTNRIAPTIVQNITVLYLPV